MKELSIHALPCAKVWCDNIGVTYLTANPVFHARNTLKLTIILCVSLTGITQISTNEQVTNGFTKTLAEKRLEGFRYNPNLFKL